MNALLLFVVTNAAITLGLFLLILALKPLLKNPAILHWLWLIVLIKLLTPPLWTPEWRMLPADGQVASRNASESRPDPANELNEFSQPFTIESPLHQPSRQAKARVIESERDEVLPVAHAAPSAAPLPISSSREPQPKAAAAVPSIWNRLFTYARLNALTGIIAIWAIGVCALWSLAIWRIVRLERGLRFAEYAPTKVQQLTETLAVALGLRRVPRVLLAPGNISPMLWAFCAPARIVVPSEFFQELDERAQRSLLLHELAHYKRGDHYVRFLELAAMGIYWWFPVAWLVRREIRRAEELACDAEVIAQLPSERRAYAEMLVHTVAFVSTSSTPALASGIATPGQLEERLRNIMRSTIDLRISGRAKILVTLMALGVLPLAPVLVRAQRAASQAPSAEQEAKKDLTSERLEWLRGSGETLEIRIRGEILDEFGKPAVEAKLTSVIIDGDGRTVEQPALLRGNQFETWVPVGKLQWFGLHLACNSSDGKSSASMRIGLEAIRQSAIDGVKLQLRPFDRTIEIRVVDKGKMVEGAKVRLNSVMRRELQEVTDKDGIARYGMFKNERPTEMTAWTADHRIGGYTFSRQPSRDPNVALHTIELSSCKPQKIRFVDVANDARVNGLNFVFYVATPDPYYNFVGLIPDAAMKTDAKGEATFEYFPDWPAHYFYVDRIDKEWVKAGKEIVAADGAIEVQVKRSQIANRKRVSGKVTSFDGVPGGYALDFDSFDGEEENRRDILKAFTDENGNFSINALPGSTYCAHVTDPRFFSDFVVVLAFDPKTGQTTEPKFHIVEGNPVEVFVNEGPNKKPIAGQYVSLFNYHPYTRLLKGETRHGNGMHQWFAVTDDNGIARSYSRAGQDLTVNVYQPDWDKETKVSTKAGEVTKVEINRPSISRQKIAGQLTLPAEIEAKLEGAEIVVSALDGVSRDELKIKADAEGKFTFDTSASIFGLFSSTTDNKAAGSAIVRVGEVGELLTIPLLATSDFEGRLLDEEGAPIANHTIEAAVLVQRNLEAGETGRRSFRAKAITATTNEKGDYALKGIPYFVNLVLDTATPGDPKSTQYLDEAFLTPGEKRPRQVSRLASNKTKAIPLKDRFESGLRDARLGGYRMMLVLFDSTSDNEEFVNLNFYNYDQIPEIARTSFKTMFC